MSSLEANNNSDKRQHAKSVEVKPAEKSDTALGAGSVCLELSRWDATILQQSNLY